MRQPSAGQFWRDVEIGDLLKVLQITTDQDSGLPYAKCMCIVRGKPFGVMEFKASRLGGEDSNGYVRFIIVPKILSWWYERKYKKVK